MSPYTEQVIHNLIVQRRIFLTLNVLAALSFFLLYNRTNDLTSQIQQQRHETIFRECVQQNARHDAAFLKLDEIIAQLPESRKRAAKASEGNTKILINAITPKQDCDAVVAKAVTTTG